MLGACDFNMIFTYVMVRWEGVAHDARVLAETLAQPSYNFPIPPPGMHII